MHLINVWNMDTLPLSN